MKTMIILFGALAMLPVLSQAQGSGEKGNGRASNSPSRDSGSASIGDYCLARQKLEARIAWAKENDLKTNDVKAVAVEGRAWTRSGNKDHGSDVISVTSTVTASDQDSSAPATENSIVKYVVSATQIESSKDCTITKIEKLEETSTH